MLLKKLSLGNGCFVKLMTGVFDNSLGHRQEDNPGRRPELYYLLIYEGLEKETDMRFF